MTEEIIQAIHGSPDHPLRIGDIEIPCYVLEDGRRILTQTGVVKGIGMSRGGFAGPGTDRLAKFTTSKGIGSYVSPELLKATTDPITFRLPTGGVAYGYEATILVDMCEAVLQARKEGRLQKQQEHIAETCEILMRGFARVGIIALVDEATGYQDYRARKALEKILEKFITEELVKWAKRFPDDFYREMFRLRGWSYSSSSVKRPALVGRLTNDIVYARLAPGVLQELKRITPRDERGRLKHHFHRHLTTEIGHPKLQEHLISVVTLMKASANWQGFYRLIQRALPRQDANLEFAFDDSELD